MAAPVTYWDHIDEPPVSRHSERSADEQVNVGYFSFWG
jgi:hypothetical protein